jgi:hypothetical protein
MVKNTPQYSITKIGNIIHKIMIFSGLFHEFFCTFFLFNFENILFKNEKRNEETTTVSKEY